MRSSAQVSDATDVAPCFAKLAEPEGRKPRGSTMAIERPADRDDQRVRALDSLQRIEQLIFGLARLGTAIRWISTSLSDEVWKIEALGDQIGAQRVRVRELPLWARASGPSWYPARIGCALARTDDPAVE